VGSFGKAVLLAIAMIFCFTPTQALADRAKARALTAEGQLRAEQGLQEQALALYEKAIGSDPDYHASYELAIPLWMRLGKLGEAQSSLERLTLRCKECSFAWYALGALYRKGARYDLAVLAYEMYLARRPQDPDAHFGLAMALAAQEDKKAAPVLRRYLQLELRPERAAYRAQARELLASLRGQEEEHPARALDQSQRATSDAQLSQVASLIAGGQLVSAESLLDQRYPASAATLRLRAKIADARGLWFPKACYQALLLLWL
jgi:tetratricopeptide (TPR) repeat protein